MQCNLLSINFTKPTNSFFEQQFIYITLQISTNFASRNEAASQTPSQIWCACRQTCHEQNCQMGGQQAFFDFCNQAAAYCSSGGEEAPLFAAAAPSWANKVKSCDTGTSPGDMRAGLALSLKLAKSDERATKPGQPDRSSAGSHREASRNVFPPRDELAPHHFE